MDPVEAIGVLGIILVFASFIVKDWRWLYAFNMSGAALLAVYAYFTGSPVFLVVESGIVVFLAYRLYKELTGGYKDGCGDRGGERP